MIEQQVALLKELVAVERLVQFASAAELKQKLNDPDIGWPDTETSALSGLSRQMIAGFAGRQLSVEVVVSQLTLIYLGFHKSIYELADKATHSALAGVTSDVVAHIIPNCIKAMVIDVQL